MNSSKSIPPYSVRESNRAKRVTLRLSLGDGLEVVVPRGFNRESIPKIIREKEDWIQKTLKKLEGRRTVADTEESSPLPGSIYFEAMDQRFSVSYRMLDTGAVELLHRDPFRIEIAGSTENVTLCRSLLKLWLQQQGKIHLVPWLRRVSERTGLSYRRAQVRGQKSRWGSCSNTGTISLNHKLLFLPPELVEYILVHELCHTAHPNHSPRFWSLVAEIQPDYQVLDARMKTAGRKVPHWAM